MKKSSRDRRTTSWWDHALTVQRNDVKRLWRSFMANRTEERRERYLAARRDYHSSIRRKKTQLLRAAIEAEGNQDVWRLLRKHRDHPTPTSIVDKDGLSHAILITEKKNQGTNDLRAQEGKKKQAKGNAIERLGKNVIGFRTAFKSEAIFPFVCFGDGCDFDDDSSILDRVVTIAQFGALNVEHLHKQGEGDFDRGSFYFRVSEWTEDEMYERAVSIAEKSVYYYFSKLGKEAFLPSELAP